MKKKILIFLFLILGFFFPRCVFASILDEVSPVIHIQGIDEGQYKISKTISKDKIIVTLKNRETEILYSWSFYKDEIDDEIDLNFEIDFSSPKKEEIDNLTKNIDKMYVSFVHHGDLPSKAVIKINVSSKYQDGEKLYLYYFNEEKGYMEFIDKNLEVKDGYVEFEIDHCSDYILTATIVNDAANNPKNMNYVIIGLVSVVIVLIGITIFTKKN